MFPALRRRLTYANVTATLALFLALSGSAYSAAGGNFILGQINSAGTEPTRLSANTSASTLRLTNTGIGPGNIVVAQGSGVKGTSSGAHGVEGLSTSNAGSGVLAQNTSGGWALNAGGNATQSRASGGFVKAMAYVSPNSPPADQIYRCFNSQLPPSQATSGDCGITFFKNGTGDYRIDFGFDVTDRFLSVTVFGFNVTTSATPYIGPVTSALVQSWSAPDGSPADSLFYIFVY